jgi:hypothetical protein
LTLEMILHTFSLKPEAGSLEPFFT